MFFALIQNIRIVAKYYTKIRMKRLSEQIVLPIEVSCFSINSILVELPIGKCIAKLTRYHEILFIIMHLLAVIVHYQL